MSKARCFYVGSVGARHIEGRKHRRIQQTLEDHVLILFYFENHIHPVIHSFYNYVLGARHHFPLGRHIMKNETPLLLENLGLRDGSAPKSVHSSPRRPKLSSLPPHRKLTPAPGDAPARTCTAPPPDTFSKKKILKCIYFRQRNLRSGYS